MGISFVLFEYFILHFLFTFFSFYEVLLNSSVLSEKGNKSLIYSLFL